MTAQAPELFEYKNSTYPVLKDIDGTSLFNPFVVGLVTESRSTACWRGFQSTYAILDNKLILKSLAINLREFNHFDETGVKPPELNGVAAKIDGRSAIGPWLYDNVGLTIEYSGQLIIGSDIVHHEYYSEFSDNLWNYRYVFSLTFEEGNLVKEVDCSELMAEQRREKDLVDPAPVPRRIDGEYLSIPEFLKKQNE